MANCMNWIGRISAFVAKPKKKSSMSAVIEKTPNTVTAKNAQYAQVLSCIRPALTIKRSTK